VPECVAFDAWYASVDNLRLIRDCGWRWLTQLRSNRLVNPDRRGNRTVRDCAIAETGRVVHLTDYGMVKVFRIVTPAGDTEYWATNDVEIGEGERLKYAEFAWGIEVYHRALKQECGVERAMYRPGERKGTTSAVRLGHSSDWNGTDCGRESAGSWRRKGSSARHCVAISSIPGTPSLHLRKS
jgi:hypothetical protein